MENTETNSGATTIESYWFKRKKEREDLAEEKDKKALKVLAKVCDYYKANYPKSKYEIIYEGPMENIVKPSFDVSRENAIKFRKALEYCRSERVALDDMMVGHALWRVNLCIPDLSKLNKIYELEKKKQELDREIYTLKTMKKEIAKPLPEPKPFKCNWCGKEFIGATAKQEIQAHIHACKVRPEGEAIEIEETPEKMFTCQICGVVLNRYDMKNHAMGKCKAPKVVKITEPKAEPKITEFKCSQCSKVCKTANGLTSHMKTHDKGD